MPPSVLLGIGLDRALDALFAVFDEPASMEGKAVERLRHVVRRTVEVLVAELPYVSLLLRVRGNTATEQRALDRRRTFDRTVRALFAEAIADGDLRAGLDPALTERLVFGMINSTVEWYRPRSETTVDDLVGAVLAIIDGLRR